MNEQKTGSEEPSKTAPGAIKNAARGIAVGLTVVACGLLLFKQDEAGIPFL